MKLAPFWLMGGALGVAGGTWNFLAFWMDPLDDSVAAMLLIYAPMFICWAVAGSIAARRTRRLTDAITAGALCAFSTFVVFGVANIIRVNAFLDTLREWPGWQQTVVARYRVSGFESFRVFTNYDYLKDAPLKIATATMIGATLGAIGGMTGKVFKPRNEYK